MIRDIETRKGIILIDSNILKLGMHFVINCSNLWNFDHNLQLFIDICNNCIEFVSVLTTTGVQTPILSKRGPKG